MKTTIKKLLPFVVGIGILWAGIAIASTLQGFQGGTGFGSATSSNVGQALIVASTSPYLTYTFGNAGGGTVNLTGSSTAFSYPYWLDANGNLSSSSPIYVSGNNVGIGTTAPNTALDVAGDITDRNVTSSPFLATNASGTIISDILVAGAGISVNTGTSTTNATTTITNTGVTAITTSSPIQASGNTGNITLSCPTCLTSLAAGTGISVSGNTITNTGVTSFNGSTGAVTGVGSFNGATGTVSVALPSIATTTKTIYDLAPATTDYPSFIINAPATTTIKEVDCFNDNAAGNTFTFNIVVSSTVTTGLTYASSSLLFAANQTCTATSTASVLTSFANATIGKGQTAWLWLTAASSTAAHVQIDY